MWYVRHKTLLTAIVLIGVAILMVLGGIIPTYESANERLAKIKQKTTELEDLSNRVSVLSNLDPVVLEQRLSILDAALPPKKDVLLYLTAVEGLSQELGLSFGGISLSPGLLSDDSTESAKKASKASKVNATSGVQTLETQVRVNGGKDNIYTFLRTIEQILPLMEIKDIKVISTNNEQYSLSLTLAMLWAQPNTQEVKGKIDLFGSEEDKYFEELAGYRKFLSMTNNIVISDQTGKENIFAIPGVNEVVEVTPQP